MDETFKLIYVSPHFIFIVRKGSLFRPHSQLIFFTSLFILVSCTPYFSQKLITVADARIHKAILIDTGKQGDSVGDLLAFDQPLLDEQLKPIGHNIGSCIRTQVGLSSQCQWTLTFVNGSIQVAGQEFDKGTSTIAITGGTGEYADIRGQMKSINNGDGTFKQILHYWTR